MAAVGRVAIRPLARGDLAAVVALDAEATGMAKAAYWERLFGAYAPAGANRHAFAAELDGALVGYVLGEVRSWEFGSQPCGWVFAINVARRLQEAGIGTRLLEALCAAFRTDGVATVRTMVARDATLLLSFFRAQGMTAGPFLELEMPLADG